MRRWTTLMAIGAALVLTACGGNRAVQGQRNLTPQIVAAVRTYGAPRSVALLGAALANLRRQNFGNAIQAATLAIESGNLTPRGISLGYSIRATAYGMTNRRTLARADISEALRADPRNVMALNARGGEALLALDFATAERYFSKSISIRPTGRAHFGRAYIRYVRRQYSGALSDAKQSIAIFPRPSAPYALRGLIEHAMGRKTAARRDFNEALRRNPRSRLASDGLRALNAGRAPFRPRQFRQRAPGSREGSI